MSDPNELLTRIRKIVGRDRLDYDEFAELTEYFEALDGWLSAPKNGYLPTAWRETTDRYESTLRLIGKNGCEHTVHYPGDLGIHCKEDGRVPDAEYLADKYCDACIANSVLPPVSDDP
jgi:hypothetical protein